VVFRGKSVTAPDRTARTLRKGPFEHEKNVGEKEERETSQKRRSRKEGTPWPTLTGECGKETDHKSQTKKANEKGGGKGQGVRPTTTKN